MEYEPKLTENACLPYIVSQAVKGLVAPKSAKCDKSFLLQISLVKQIHSMPPPNSFTRQNLLSMAKAFC